MGLSAIHIFKSHLPVCECLKHDISRMPACIVIWALIHKNLECLRFCTDIIYHQSISDAIPHGMHGLHISVGSFSERCQRGQNAVVRLRRSRSMCILGIKGREMQWLGPVDCLMTATKASLSTLSSGSVRHLPTASPYTFCFHGVRGQAAFAASGLAKGWAASGGSTAELGVCAPPSRVIRSSCCPLSPSLRIRFSWLL